MPDQPTQRSRRPLVLVADDQRSMAEMLADGLTDQGFDAVTVESGEAAVALLESSDIDAVVTDLRMSNVDGFGVLSASRRLDPDRPVIIMTAYSAIDSAVEAIRQGAYHYLAKPFPMDELCIFLRRGLEDRANRAEASTFRKVLATNSADGIVAESPAMQRILSIVDRVASADAAVLLLGETGTGKGRIAAALHARGVRSRSPFVAVNCAAVPESLLESELFGHVKGAFTGATNHRVGLFAAADGGTLFLDEIGDMPMSLQSKLLHALDQRRIRPVGSNEDRIVDVRLIAATHRNLHTLVREGLFREDLLYRIEVVTLELPPLRERPEDVTALIAHFFEEARARYAGSPARTISSDALTLLLSYSWPGNVRELAHVLERMVLLARAPQIDVEDLPILLPRPKKTPSFHDVIPMREMQRNYATWAYDRLGRSRMRTADKLGIDYKTLVRLLEPPEQAGNETSTEAAHVSTNPRGPR